MGDFLRKRVKQSADFESPEVEALLNLLVAADHMRGRMEQVCSQFDITASQYNILRILRGAGQEGLPRGGEGAQPATGRHQPSYPFAWRP